MDDFPIYDLIGRGYRKQRKPEHAMEHALKQALGEAQTVLNVGAGAGSYEPQGRKVFALEPSIEMIGQRGKFSAPVVRGVVEHLPFAERAVDACMGVLTMHHWKDPARGLQEMMRVARERIVLLTWLPETPFFWLYNYFPQLWTKDQEIFPEAAWYESQVPNADWIPLPVPKDCADGFLGAYWARPEAYLEESVRGAMSTFTKIDTRPGVKRLAKDLESGQWQQRYGPQMRYTHMDLGYRLLVVRHGG